MRVIVNDEPRETAAATLAALLEELGCAQEPAVAAAVDGQVVPRTRPAATGAPGDKWGVQNLFLR